MTGLRRHAGTCQSWLLFLALFAVPVRGSAEPVAAGCPDRAAVLRALHALSAQKARGAKGSPDEHVELSTEDDGDSYRVSVNGKTRSYADLRRDCGERAQVAAVFAALVLSSPSSVDSGAEPTGAPAPPPAPAAATPSAAPAPRATLAPAATPARTTTRAATPARVPHLRRWWLDAGASLALAPGRAGPPLELGVELGLAYVPREFGLAFGLRLPARAARLPVGDATAHLLRYPIDLVGRWLVLAPPFEGTLDAGVVLSLLRLRQAEDSGRSPQSRVEAGLRLASRWQLIQGAISPWIVLFSEVIPVRYELALEPTGVLAKTPGLWLGAALGVSARFD